MGKKNKNNKQIQPELPETPVINELLPDNKHIPNYESQSLPELPQGLFNENNIGNMMKEVNSILQTNPEMVKNVSKCVTNIFQNEELLNKIMNQMSNK
jgi:hypothetical protein